MTPAEEAQFIQLWQDGASYKAIAAALGCPLGTVASRSAALVAQGKITPTPRGGDYPSRRATAQQGTVHDAVQSSAVQSPMHGAQTVQNSAVHATMHGAETVQNSAELPIPAALAAELSRLWAAIEALQQEMHRPVQATVHDTVQSLPEPLFDDPADNATERWNLYLKHGLRVRLEALAQARGIAPSRVVQEILWQALTDRRSAAPSRPT
jgi:hypothetical protein